MVAYMLDKIWIFSLLLISFFEKLRTAISII